MLNGKSVLRPELYKGVRLPLLEAETLPNWCYTAQEFHDREIEQIFLKNWIFVGRTDEIPNAGDFLAVDYLAGGPVFIVRDKDGSVLAFANSCRHRGSLLVHGSGKGTCPGAITCPYHGWTYATNGNLIAAPAMDRTKKFRKEDYGLMPVRLETWAGFMFVNFDPDAGKLMSHLGDFPEQFAAYRLDEITCVRRKEYNIEANWKLYIENIEFYHTAQVHNDTVGTQIGDLEPTKGEWEALFMPCDEPIGVLPGETSPLPHFRSLKGNPAQGTYFALIYPNTMFVTTQDCMWWISLYPTEVTRSKISVGFCFPNTTIEHPEFEKAVQRYYYRWDRSIPEDDRAVEVQQLGLRSRVRPPGRLSWVEPVVHAFDNWVLDRVLEGKASGQ